MVWRIPTCKAVRGSHALYSWWVKSPQLVTLKIYLNPEGELVQIEILFDVAVSPNLVAENRGVTCAFPLSARLHDGTVACVYRQGATKHSHDGVLIMQRSQDGGRHWSAPQTVANGLGEMPTQTVITGGLCQTPGGALLASFGSVEGLPPNVYPFGAEGERYPLRFFLTRSEDGGASWCKPTQPDLRPLGRVGVTGPPFVAANGAVCVPIECRIPSGVNATALIISHDDGRTFAPPVMVAGDERGRLNLCDARFDVLPDGRLIALLWTFLQENERTIEVHRCFSSDHGQTWSSPQSLGFVGQITAPLVLPDGRVLAASNYRHAPLGSLLWHSNDGGTTWATDQPIQLWDAEQGAITGRTVNLPTLGEVEERIWDELQRFSFGTPDLLLLGDGTVLLTYYATLQGVLHVRACTFRVSD